MMRAMPRRRAAPLLVLAVASLAWQSLEVLFAMQAPSQRPGPSKKMNRGQLHNKDTLGEVVELPREEPEEEPVPKPAPPQHRLPYTTHFLSQYPQGRHLKEDSKNQRFIEEKVTAALENFEDMIKHVEVHLEVHENFHREKTAKSNKQKAAGAVEDDDISSLPDTGIGHKILAPYVFKATVTLKNQKTVSMAHPEKHARPTLQEALDHMIDVLRGSLREEKDRKMSQAKKARKNAMPDTEEETLEEVLLVEEALADADAAAQDELLYDMVEGAEDDAADDVTPSAPVSEVDTSSKGAADDAADDVAPSAPVSEVDTSSKGAAAGDVRGLLLDV